MFRNLRSFLEELRRRGDLLQINAPVNPHLEAAEIHRRVIVSGGPALLFTNITGASFPLVTNLFGTKDRIDLAFGNAPERFVQDMVSLIQQPMPPSLGSIWERRRSLTRLASFGTKAVRNAPALECVQTPAKLSSLPLLTTWKLDGGAFVTLPLCHTQHPQTGIPNLGMYRLQRFDDQTTGFHCQIGKGAGYHLSAAATQGIKLPVNVYLGGPPALIVSAIAPLPENVPELLLTSLLVGEKLRTAKNPHGPIPIVAESEFVLVGEIDPQERRLEGPFGDHYGYYSLEHEFPVLHLKAICHRRDAICTATVVGKPKQEDFFLGDYLQQLLSPLFPVVMPTVRALWSYGETGFHSLSAAVVHARYKREGLTSAFRILGEGQLALTKFLLLTDAAVDVRDFKSLLTAILERFDPREDLYLFGNTAMDTLDYNGPKLNRGSKGVMMGIGAPIRTLPTTFSGTPPGSVVAASVFSPGCLVLQLKKDVPRDELPQIAAHPSFADWPLLCVVDLVESACSSTSNFLWTVFTRFDPSQHVFPARVNTHGTQISFEGPILIDARLKPGFPDELVCDPETKQLVDRRWNEYFSR